MISSESGSTKFIQFQIQVNQIKQFSKHLLVQTFFILGKKFNLLRKQLFLLAKHTVLHNFSAFYASESGSRDPKESGPTSLLKMVDV